jgi:hypothetical protein
MIRITFFFLSSGIKPNDWVLHHRVVIVSRKDAKGAKEILSGYPKTIQPLNRLLTRHKA